MKFNRKWLWLIIPIIIFSLSWINSSSISTVLLAIKGTITDGNLIKFSGTAGIGEDAEIIASDVVTKTGDFTAGRIAKINNATGIIEQGTNTDTDVSDAVTKKHTQNTDTVAGGEWSFGAHSAGFTLQTATGDGTTTIDWKLGNKFEFTFGAQNDTFTFTAPTNPGNFMLWLIQDATGSRTITWPNTVRWAGGVAPTLTTTANAVDIVSFPWNGTYYDGQCAKAFAVP